MEGGQKIFKEGKKAKEEKKRLVMLVQAVNSLWLAGSCIGSGSLVWEAGEIKGKEPSHKNRPSAQAKLSVTFVKPTCNFWVLS